MTFDIFTYKTVSDFAGFTDEDILLFDNSLHYNLRRAATEFDLVKVDQLRDIQKQFHAYVDARDLAFSRSQS